MMAADERAVFDGPERVSGSVSGFDASFRVLFWEAFTSSRSPMLVLDADRRLTEVNAACVRAFRRSREEMIGRPMWEFISGGPVYTKSEWDALLATERFTGEADVLAADGRPVRVQFAGHPAPVLGGHLVLVVVLAAEAPERNAASTAPAELSARELQVVTLIARGHPDREIAAELHLAHDTVRTHVRNAMGKLGVRSRAQLVARSLGDAIVLR